MPSDKEWHDAEKELERIGRPFIGKFCVGPHGELNCLLSVELRRTLTVGIEVNFLWLRQTGRTFLVEGIQFLNLERVFHQLQRELFDLKDYKP